MLQGRGSGSAPPGVSPTGRGSGDGVGAVEAPPVGPADGVRHGAGDRYRRGCRPGTGQDRMRAPRGDWPGGLPGGGGGRGQSAVECVAAVSRLRQGLRGGGVQACGGTGRPGRGVGGELAFRSALDGAASFIGDRIAQGGLEAAIAGVGLARPPRGAVCRRSRGRDGSGIRPSRVRHRAGRCGRAGRSRRGGCWPGSRWTSGRPLRQCCRGRCVAGQGRPAGSTLPGWHGRS